MASANTRQVGGSHYQTEFQHWDFIIEVFGPEYLVGCATKYVTRHKKKNGLQDLEKASHYVEKLIECAANGIFAKVKDSHRTLEFVTVNKLEELETRICALLFNDYTTSDLYEARGLIENLIDKAKQPKIDNTGQKHPFGYKDED